MVFQNNQTLFLNQFTKELILNSKREYKFIPPFHPTFPSTKLMSIQEVQEIMHQKLQVPLQIKQEISQVPIKQEITQTTIKPETTQVQPMPIKTQLLPTKTILPQKITAQQIPPLTQIPIPATIANIFPGAYPIPQNFSLNKLDMFISDTRIASIECQGPDKPVLIRSLGMITPTKLNLTEEEIHAIVKTFADAARIPLIGGVFKAAVGNLIMTAVLSEFVGSRFIINKYNPYSMPPMMPQVPLR